MAASASSLEPRPPSDLEVIARDAVSVHGALQDPWELARLLEAIAQRLKPGQAILEIGCGQGGTLWAWRTAFPRSLVIGVDNLSQHDAFGWRLDAHGASLLNADSQDPRTLWQVEVMLGGHPLGFLHIDGDHHAAAVRRDLSVYGSLVAKGGLIALHDIKAHAAEPNHSFDFRPLDQRKGAQRRHNVAMEVDVVWHELPGDKLEIVNPAGTGMGLGLLFR